MVTLFEQSDIKYTKKVETRHKAEQFQSYMKKRVVHWTSVKNIHLMKLYNVFSIVLS